MGKSFGLFGVGALGCSVAYLVFQVSSTWTPALTERFLYGILAIVGLAVVMFINWMFMGRKQQASGWGDDVPASQRTINGYAQTTPSAAPIVVHSGSRRGGGTTEVYFPNGFPGQPQYGGYPAQPGWTPPVTAYGQPQYGQPQYGQQGGGFDNGFGGGFGGGFPGMPVPNQNEGGFNDNTGGNVW